MKITTLKKLQAQFVGKICTILTNPLAKTNFSDTQFSDFFTGVIDSLDEDGIFATHPVTACKNFYNLANVVGIIEEQVLYEDNPEHAEIIKQVKEKHMNSQNPQNPLVERIEQPGMGNFADINLMDQLAKNH
jgi:hypothetical protein